MNQSTSYFCWEGCKTTIVKMCNAYFETNKESGKDMDHTMYQYLLSLSSWYEVNNYYEEEFKPSPFGVPYNHLFIWDIYISEPPRSIKNINGQWQKRRFTFNKREAWNHCSKACWYEEEGKKSEAKTTYSSALWNKPNWIGYSTLQLSW